MGSLLDPVHGWIKYTSQEQIVIDSPLVQRLRWISQLTGAHEVFPGGTVSRFIHSIGVMHLAGEYYDAINSPNCLLFLDNRWRTTVRMAALLHDVGHGPFSHAFDGTIYKMMYGIDDGGHDLHRIKIVRSPLMAPYLKQCGVDPEDLICIWKGKVTTDHRDAIKYRFDDPMYPIPRAIVQGPLGADRIDFTLRDAWSMGIDQNMGSMSQLANRIINSCSLHLVKGEWKFHYNLKVAADIVHLLDKRRYMYENIYLHPGVCGADILIRKAMELATEGLSLQERTQDLDRFVYLADHTIIGEILGYNGNNQKMRQAKSFIEMLLLRRLPKMVSEHRVRSPVTAPQQGNNLITVSRLIEGIQPDEFYKAGIYFYSDLGVGMTCRETLDSIGYKEQSEPFHFVRVYSMSAL